MYIAHTYIHTDITWCHNSASGWPRYWTVHVSHDWAWPASRDQGTRDTWSAGQSDYWPGRTRCSRRTRWPPACGVECWMSTVDCRLCMKLLKQTEVTYLIVERVQGRISCKFKLCCLVHAIHYGRSPAYPTRKQSSQSAPVDHVPGYAHLPPHRWTTLYHGCARSSASGRSHMRVLLPPGTLCPTTSAPWLILSSSENCWSHTILVKLLTLVDFCVFLGVLAFVWLL